jgi:hypothetical protein
MKLIKGVCFLSSDIYHLLIEGKNNNNFIIIATLTSGIIYLLLQFGVPKVRNFANLYKNTLKIIFK